MRLLNWINRKFKKKNKYTDNKFKGLNLEQARDAYKKISQMYPEEEIHIIGSAEGIKQVRG